MLNSLISGADGLVVTGLLADQGVFERASSAIQASTSYSRGDRSDIQTIVPSAPTLHDDDIPTIRQLYSELRKMCQLAKDHRIRIAFDAEQSWLQPCLDRLVAMLSAEFNCNTIVIYNTYQANLKQAVEAVQRDLQQAKNSGMEPS